MLRLNFDKLTCKLSIDEGLKCKGQKYETNLSLEGKYLFLSALVLRARENGFWERIIHFGLYFSIFWSSTLIKQREGKEEVK